MKLNKKTTKTALIYLIPGILFFTLIGGCNEQPTELGMILHQDTIVLEGFSTPEYKFITDYEAFRVHETYLQSAFLTGKAGEVEASTLMQIGFDQRPDTLDYLTEEDIIEAKLNIYANDYVFGNEQSPQLAFDVKRVERQWHPKSNFVDSTGVDYSKVFTTWDSLFVSPANYFGETVGFYSGSIDVDDSLSRILQLSIDPSYIIELFRTDGSNEQPHPENWGFGLVPREESNVVHQFNFYGVGDDINKDDGTLRTPHFRVIYNSKEGTVDTLKIYVETAAQFCTSPPPASKRFVLQSGDNWRTSINFNIDSIPVLAGIVKADLEIFYDSENSFYGSSGQDSIINLAWVSDTVSSTLYSDLTYTGYRVDSTNSYYFPSIGSSYEWWLRTNAHRSLVLLPYQYTSDVQDRNAEPFHIDRLSFFGPEAEDPAKRPKLRVIYSYVPEKE